MKFESQEVTRPDPSHQPPAVASPSWPLFPLSPAEFFQISTLRNPRNAHHPCHTISTEFLQTGKFEDWATRYAIEKLVYSLTTALHERDELQKRLKMNVNKQKRAKASCC